MATSQPGILNPLTPAAHFVTLGLVPDAPARAIVERLRELPIDDALVVGIGEPLVRAIGATVPRLRTFPAMTGPGCAIPSTQAALYLDARGRDAGEALATMRRALAVFDAHVTIAEDVAAAKYDIGRDLSGYEDGTENPKGDAAAAAALTGDGGSFVAVQRWVHDLARLERFASADRDGLIGRARDTNAELEHPPVHAHVKRAQQESFDPPAFMVRRSLPYGTVREHGLYFVAYVADPMTFERMLARMVGAEDGVVDGLFAFSRPVTGGYYWCPPVRDGHLDLRALA